MGARLSPWRHGETFYGAGDSQLFATLHLRFGFIEARRGCQDLAARHLDAAERLLEDDGSPYLQGTVWVAKAVVSCLRDDVVSGRFYVSGPWRPRGGTDTSAWRRPRWETWRNLLWRPETQSRVRRLLVRFESVRGTLTSLAVCHGHCRPVGLLGRRLRRRSTKLRLAFEGSEDGIDKKSPSWPTIEANLTRVRLLRHRGRAKDALELSDHALALRWAGKKADSIGSFC